MRRRRSRVLNLLRNRDAETLQRELFALEDKTRMAGIYSAMGFLQGCIEDATFYLLDQMALPALDDDMLVAVRELLAHVDASLPSGSLGRTKQQKGRRATP